MDPIAQAHSLGEVANLISMALVLYLVVALVVFLPRGRKTRRYGVLVAADPETVWNTYFFHRGHRDYRPGMRFLKCEVLAETPLTVRYTVQADYASRPSIQGCTYDVYEPYSRYRLTAGPIVEEGELEQAPDGTWLRVAITGPMRGWMFPWALRRRHAANYRALKDVCEGRQPEAPRGGLPARWWERWFVGVLGAVLAVTFSERLGLPMWPAAALLVLLTTLTLIRSTKFVLRLLAV